MMNEDTTKEEQDAQKKLIHSIQEFTLKQTVYMILLLTTRFPASAAVMLSGSENPLHKHRALLRAARRRPTDNPPQPLPPNEAL